MPLSTTPPPAISSPSTDATLIDANDFVRNTGKLLVEINRLKALAQRNPSAIIAGHDGKNYKIDDYISWLQGQALTPSSIGPGVEETPGIELEDIPESQESKETEAEQMIASVQAQILDAENNIEILDKYVLGLLTGKDFTELTSLANNKNKFIKLSENETTKKFQEEEVLEPVEKYFNDLYDDTPGSPNYGDEMTKKYTSKNPKFKIIKK